MLELDDFWTRPGHRAPEHVHPEMEETFEVIAGSAAIRIGGEDHTVAAGDSVTAPPGTPHLAWNATDELVHLRLSFRPALRWEDFLVGLFQLSADAHAAGGSEPDPARLAALARDFPREIAAPRNH